MKDFSLYPIYMMKDFLSGDLVHARKMDHTQKCVMTFTLVMENVGPLSTLFAKTVDTKKIYHIRVKNGRWLIWRTHIRRNAGSYILPS
jgi:hypothetical protein